MNPPLPAPEPEPDPEPEPEFDPAPPAPEIAGLPWFSPVLVAVAETVAEPEDEEVVLQGQVRMKTQH